MLSFKNNNLLPIGARGLTPVVPPTFGSRGTAAALEGCNGLTRAWILVAFHQATHGWFSLPSLEEDFQSVILYPCQVLLQLLFPIDVFGQIVS